MVNGEKGMAVCEVCGNEKESASLLCPYCGSMNEDDDGPVKKSFIHKIVNLESGRPVAEIAVNKMTEVLEDARRNGITIVTLIHGYGSSGKGGVIRSECRKTLDYMRSKGTIEDYIVGEEFYKRSGRVKYLLRKYPQLEQDRNLNRNNRGITLVVI